MIEIRTLGPLQLRAPGETDPAAILSRAKRAALLVYLACARPYGPRRRDELIGMFWPELEQARAGRALNQSVYVLRSVVGEPVVTTRNTEIGLDADLVWVDAVAFDAASVAGDHRAAIDLYRGVFLQGFHLSNSLQFDRWLEAEREHYRWRAVDAAVGLSAREEADGNLAEATRWVRRAIELDPFQETLLRRLLGLLVGQGDHAKAVRELDRFSTRLREELGTDVSEETRRLVRPAGAVEGGIAARRDAALGAGLGKSFDEATDASVKGPPKGDVRTPPGRTRAGHFRKLALGALAVLAAVALGSGIRRGSDAPSRIAAHDETRVMVAPFENRTDDPGLDQLGRIAADWISRGLIETGLVEVVPGTLPVGDRNRWAAVGASAGAELIVTGSVQRDGGEVVLATVVIDVRENRILRSLEPMVTAASAPLSTIERIRARTVGALATTVDPRMTEWANVASQPPSYAAYRLFAEGLELLEEERYVEAGDRFREAAARDSTFTSAVLWAIEAYSLTGDGPRDSLTLALAPRRDQLAPWDRAMLDHHLARIRGDLQGQYDSLRDIVRLSPTGQWQVLLARQALWLNRPGEAARILAEVEPSNVRGIPERMYWGTGLESLHMRGEYLAELERVGRWREASARLPPYAELAELRALAGLGRVVDVLRYVEDEPRFRSWTWQTADRLRHIALELRVHGHREAAHNVLQRVFDLYEASSDSVRGDPQTRRQLGRSFFTSGRLAESRAVFEGLLAEGHDPHVARGDLAVAAAGLGDRALAEQVERWYAEWAQENPTQNGWATQWRARIVALLGDRDRAVELIVQAHEEGWPHWTWDELVEEYQVLRGYEPFEAVMGPQG